MVVIMREEIVEGSWELYDRCCGNQRESASTGKNYAT